MQKAIHPQVYTDTVVTCACGNSFTTMSTKKDIAVEICSACHPFYTGQKRYIDTEGQIDKFTKKVKAAQSGVSAAKKAKKEAKATQLKGPVTLRDLRTKV